MLAHVGNAFHRQALGRPFLRYGGLTMDRFGNGNLEEITLLIKRGMVGPPVRDLQTALNAITGAGLKVDGIFGPNTERAVRTFQTAFKLAADGIVGKNTGTCLVAAVLCRNWPLIRAQVMSRNIPSHRRQK